MEAVRNVNWCEQTGFALASSIILGEAHLCILYNPRAINGVAVERGGVHQFALGAWIQVKTKHQCNQVWVMARSISHLRPVYLVSIVHLSLQASDSEVENIQECSPPENFLPRELSANVGLIFLAWTGHPWPQGSAMPVLRRGTEQRRHSWVAHFNSCSFNHSRNVWPPIDFSKNVPNPIFP